MAYAGNARTKTKNRSKMDLTDEEWGIVRVCVRKCKDDLIKYGENERVLDAFALTMIRLSEARLEQILKKLELKKLEKEG